MYSKTETSYSNKELNELIEIRKLLKDISISLSIMSGRMGEPPEPPEEHTSYKDRYFARSKDSK